MLMPWKDLLCYRRSRDLGEWKMTLQLFYSNPEKETQKKKHYFSFLIGNITMSGAWTALATK